MTPGDWARAEALDAADALAPFRDRFLVPNPGLVYLDGNSLGRTPLATVERVGQVVAGEWAADLITSWAHWQHLPAVVGDELAPLIGARPGEVVLHDSTTVNLYQLVHLAAALHPDRNTFVVDDTEFPTDRYVVEGVARMLGKQVRSGVDHLDADTAMVVRSLVDYRTGALADLHDATRHAHDAGATVVWDLSHAVGSVEVDLGAAGAELAVGCTYKYLNGGPGAPAFSYVASSLHDRIDQPVWGWFGQSDPFDMDGPRRPHPDARALLLGTPSILGLVSAQEGIRITAEAGMAAVAAKGRALTSYAVEHCEALGLEVVGLDVVGPGDPHRRGAHISVRHPDAAAIVERLVDQGVVTDFRHPDLVRIGCSPLTTRFVDVHEGMVALAGLLSIC